MNEEEEQAYKWALNQQFQSVAARYARVLALHIQALRVRIAELEKEIEAMRKGRAVECGVKYPTPPPNDKEAAEESEALGIQAEAEAADEAMQIAEQEAEER